MRAVIKHSMRALPGKIERNKTITKQYQVTMQYNSLKRKRNKENIYFVLSHKSHNRLFEKGENTEKHILCVE